MDDPFDRVKVQRIDTREVLADLEGDRVALVPADDLQLVDVAAHQRAIVYRKGRTVKWLGSGQHQVWTVERIFKGAARSVSAPPVAVEVLDTDAIQVSPLRDELRSLVPASDYVEATAPEGSVVVRYVGGVLEAILPPGRHASWTTVHKVQLVVIDLRERVLQVTGQEVMSKDRVALRLNLSAAFRVKDARRLATVARVPDDMLYLPMQLAAREAVSTRTLDELLAAREDAASEMHQAVASRAEVVGLELIRFGVKDVVRPKASCSTTPTVGERRSSGRTSPGVVDSQRKQADALPRLRTIPNLHRRSRPARPPEPDEPCPEESEILDPFFGSKMKARQKGSRGRDQEDGVHVDWDGADRRRAKSSPAIFAMRRAQRSSSATHWLASSSNSTAWKAQPA